MCNISKEYTNIIKILTLNNYMYSKIIYNTNHIIFKNIISYITIESQIKRKYNTVELMNI